MRHELYLAKAGIRAALPAALVVVGVAAGLGGGRGAASAAAGAGLVLANGMTAAASTGWSRTVSPNVVAVGYALFVVRMFVMFAAFAALSAVAWVNPPILAGAFCVTLVVTLVAECVGYARGSYVPAWRAQR